MVSCPTLWSQKPSSLSTRGYLPLLFFGAAQLVGTMKNQTARNSSFILLLVGRGETLQFTFCRSLEVEKSLWNEHNAMTEMATVPHEHLGFLLHTVG